MGPTRQRGWRAGPPVSGARAGEGRMGRGGEEREGGSWAEPAQEERGGKKELLLGFSFYKTFLTLFISFQLLFVL